MDRISRQRRPARATGVRARLRRPVLGTLLRLIDNRERIDRSRTPVDGRPTAASGRGPYFLADPPTRRDVREDRDGIPLTLRIHAVEATTGQPLDGAGVEIWHCDASGAYSAYQAYDPEKFPNLVAMTLRRNRPTEPGTFLRGRQTADRDGRVEFRSIVPGWYTPRTLHVHCRVVDHATTPGVELLTTELYFPEEVAADAFATQPYARRGPSPFTNVNDIEIAMAKGAPGSWLTVSRVGSGYVAEVTVRTPPRP